VSSWAGALFAPSTSASLNQAKSIRISCFALGAEQFATVGSESLLGKIALCRHKPQGAA
jgi:hypothetical protein